MEAMLLGDDDDDSSSSDEEAAVEIATSGTLSQVTTAATATTAAAVSKSTSSSTSASLPVPASVLPPMMPMVPANTTAPTPATNANTNVSVSANVSVNNNANNANMMNNLKPIPLNAATSATGMSRGGSSNNNDNNNSANVMDDPYAPTPWTAMTSSKKASVTASSSDNSKTPSISQQQQHMTSPSGMIPNSSAQLSSRSTSVTGNGTQRRGALSLSSSSSSSNAMSGGMSSSSIPSMPGRSGSTSSSGNVGGSMGMSLQQQQQEEAERKKAKEKFLMFTKVLMKYLEAKDPSLHQRAKLVIKTCAERNKAKDPEYKSLTAAMQTKLRECVGEVYWKKADEYLKHFLRSKMKEKVEREQRAVAARQQQQQKQGGNVGVPSPLPALNAPTPAVQQQAHRQVSTPKQQPPQQRAPSVSGISNSGRATPIVVSKQQQQQQNKNTTSSSVTSRMPPPISTTTPSTTQTQRSTSSSNARSTSKTSAATSKSNQATSSDTKSTSPTAPLIPANVMAMLDQNVRYDPVTAARVLTREKLQDQLSLDQEQKLLLYGSTKFTARWSKQKRQGVANSTQINDDPTVLFRGWDKRNIVSTRVAYARAHDSNIVGVEGKAELNAIDVESDDELESEKAVSKEKWVNEEIAEDDPMLTLISEATQLYVKKILETAITLSRKKQNLDGIRLWHLHHVQQRKPPLGLRLGCDVYRQNALNDADAAGTCCRMEQALLRRDFGVKDPHPEDVDGEDGLIKNAFSLVDLARRIQLPNASTDAEQFSKRKLDLYFGKGDEETKTIDPPFGRVPKKCKLTSVDLSDAYRAVVGSHRSSLLP